MRDFPRGESLFIAGFDTDFDTLRWVSIRSAGFRYAPLGFDMPLRGYSTSNGYSTSGGYSTQQVLRLLRPGHGWFRYGFRYAPLLNQQRLLNQRGLFQLSKYFGD